MDLSSVFFLVILFSNLHITNIQILKEAEQADKEDTHDTFAQFNLDPQITEILERYSITKPLNIQKTGIPKILDGANTIIAAETGCGKTLTYLLPMIDEVLNWKKMEEKREYNSPLGLIITPTRELAFQIGVCIARYAI